MHLENLYSDLVLDLRKLSQSTLFVGFSGGVDSALLLALACQAIGSENVTALHINHGLSEHSKNWQKHCEKFAFQLGCEFLFYQVVVKSQGQGLEAEARHQRFQVFRNLLPDDAVLLLGHHLDDQIETFFLRLMRGAGPHGLKAMSYLTTRDQYKIVRPLLSVTREQIEQLAQSMALEWIEDESNTDERFDRNFLRHKLLPLLETRWPSYRDRINQTIGLLEDDSVSEGSLNIHEELKHRLSHDKGLKLLKLQAFSSAQVLSLLHQWFVLLGVPVPSKKRLGSILDDVIGAKADAQPCVCIGSGSVRRHGPALYWVPSLPDVNKAPAVAIEQWCDWSGVGQVKLELVSTNEPRLKAELPDLHWRTRIGGEVMQPYGRSKARDLKRLLQEYRIKPWLRNRMPLLFSGDDLIAAGDVLISAHHLAEENEPGLKILWRDPTNFV